MIIFCLVMIIVPFLLVGVAVYIKYVQSMQNEAEQYIEQYGGQIAANLSAYFEQINDLTLRPYYETALMEVLRRNASQVNGRSKYITSTELSAIRMFLLSSGFNRPEFDGITLMMAGGNTYSTPDGGSNESEEILSLLNSPGASLTSYGFYLIPPYEKERNRFRRIVTTVIRIIKDPYENNILGYVRIDINAKMFNHIVSNKANKYGNSLYIADKKKNVYYPITQQMKPLPFETNEKVKMNGTKYNLYSSYAADLGLYVYQLSSIENILASASELFNFTMFLAIIIVCCTGIGAVWYSFRISQPIHELSRQMLHVQEGDFNVRIPVTRNDEIGRLCEGFNSMVARIRQLIVKNYEARILKNEADYKALQSRINPHFLYNTLEMINMLAIERHQFEISDTVTSLGRMMRYTVENKQPNSTLNDELQFLKAYFSILRMLNGDRFHWEIVCDPELGDCSIPKLILQPLAENAYIHGLKGGQGRIGVNVRQNGEMIVIDVEDNGQGMSQAKLDFLRKQLASSNTFNQEDGHALVNVNRRLILAYGAECGIKIQSSLGEGSKFTITVPYHRDKGLILWGGEVDGQAEGSGG